MPRVIFVGVHNKPGKTPLDSSTKSGNLIDRIIRELPDYDCIKTNLFDTDQMPEPRQVGYFVFDWIERVKLYKGDTVVLLGAIVKKHFPAIEVTAISIHHPASKRSHADMDKYVSDTVQSITRLASDAATI